MDKGLRKDIEDDIYRYADTMDPSGKNTQRYRDFFSTLSDAQFHKFIVEFFDNEDIGLTIAYEPMGDPKPFEFFEKAAETLGVALWDYMATPYLDGNTENPPVTVHKIFKGKLQVRRLFQNVNDKNSMSTSITDRNMESGQVSNRDKHARMTDVEIYSYMGQNQDDTIIEMANMRSDDMTQMSQALTQARLTGEIDLDLLDNDEMNKVAFNSMNYYFLAAGFHTNLIDNDGLMLPLTIKGKEDKTKINRIQE